MADPTIGSRVEFLEDSPGIEEPLAKHWDLDPESAAKNEVIEEIIEFLGGRERMNPSLHFRYRLVIDEALTNAISHGCPNGTESISVDCHVSPTRCVVRIHDQGPGFSYDTVPDPTAPGNEFREHGRGILIMDRYAQRVVYADQGRQVTLWLSIES